MAHADQYAKARRRAAAKNRFFVHAAVYAAVMGLLAVMNLVTSPRELWFIWPLFGWGLAVALHGMRAFWLAEKSDIVDLLAERELRQSGSGKPEEGMPRKLP